MAAVKTLCNDSIVLRNGEIDFSGNVTDGVQHYLNISNHDNRINYINNGFIKDSDILEVKILNKNASVETFAFDQPVSISFKIKVSNYHYNNLVLGFRVKDQLERNIFSSETKLNEFSNEFGIINLSTTLPASLLVPNKYSVIVGLHIPNAEIIRYIESAVSFEIEETGTEFFKYAGSDYGCVFVNCKWKLI